MKVLTAQQLRDADLYTIAHEPITALDLMERAAQQCADWILRAAADRKRLQIFCGKGGNGGDGLAIARLLKDKVEEITVYILEFGKPGTPEFERNLERLQECSVSSFYIHSEDRFPPLSKEDLIIDALYGFGLHRPLDGLSAKLVDHLNAAGAKIVSIDLPSGLFADAPSIGNPVVRATHTLTFECYKLGLLLAENAQFIGDVQVLPIGLDRNFIANLETEFETVDARLIENIFRPRNRFAHKGTFGHALLVGGSHGKIGAMVLATSACLRSGAGLVTTYVPKCGYTILQTTAPEAMTLTDTNETFLAHPPADLDRFQAIGIGPGMGVEAETLDMLASVLTSSGKPMVIDADALNGLATRPLLLSQLFQNPILTPHPKEFERLFGKSANGFEQIRLAVKKAVELKAVIILKGHRTLIALPDGKAYFNTTGNAGMAKGGSGDVLTGIITALLAQGYTPTDAAILGVYLHGCAGDVAAKKLSSETMTPQDLITHLSLVFRSINDSLTH